MVSHQVSGQEKHCVCHLLGPSLGSFDGSIGYRRGDDLKEAPGELGEAR